MRVIIHDLCEQESAALSLVPDPNTTVISDNGKIHNCISCFGCWVKTPGTCVLKDGYQNMGELLSKCDELIIISRCIYGSYSPFVRNVLDRSIPYLLPYFVTKNGETHHQKRYDHKFSLAVHFYGSDITTAEKTTAEALVKANSVNLYSTGNKVYYHNGPELIKEGLL
jgi:multimeric flavodoxin WrbA